MENESRGEDVVEVEFDANGVKDDGAEDGMFGGGRRCWLWLMLVVVVFSLLLMVVAAAAIVEVGGGGGTQWEAL